MLGTSAAMNAYPAALWYILHDRQQPLELWRHGDGKMIAQRRDLIAEAFEGVAEPATVDDKATSDGGALGLITKQLYVHNFLGFYIISYSLRSRNLINLIKLVILALGTP